MSASTTTAPHSLSTPSAEAGVHNPTNNPPSPILSSNLMDDMDDSDGTVDPALMAAMGFAAFGSTGHDRQAKRRKPNPSTGAASGTGANMVPVGSRKARGGGAEAASQHDVTSTSDGGKRLPGVSEWHGDPTSAPGAALPTFADGEGDAVYEEDGRASDGLLVDQGQGQAPPAFPLPSSHQLALPRAALGASARTAPHPLPLPVRAQGNEHGDRALFHPSFIEDPWAGLEPKRLPEKPSRR